MSGAKKKIKRDSQREIIMIVAIVMAIVFIVTGVLLAVYRDKIFGRSKPSDGVSIQVYVNGTEYKGNSGLVICSGDKLSIEIPQEQTIEGETYSLWVSVAESKEIEFMVGSEPYHWSDIAGEVITRGFTFTFQKDNSIQVTFGSLQDILEAFFHKEVTISGNVDTTGDLFTLSVRYGDSVRQIGFGVSVSVTGVEMRPDHLII